MKSSFFSRIANSAWTLFALLGFSALSLAQPGARPGTLHDGGGANSGGKPGLVGLNFQYRNPNQENGDTARDNWLNRRPWVFADSVSDSASLLASSNVWNPAFLTDISNFDVLRTIEWTMANNHPVSSWTNRRQPGDWPQISNAILHQFGAGSSQYRTAVANETTLRTQAPGDGNGWGGALGVAWEWIADLANKADKPIWINVPHRANDDYVRNLAVLLRDQITTSQKMYVEYSNEVWNNGSNFAGQYEWCVTRGFDANLAGLPTPGTSIQNWIARQGNGMNGEGQAREGYYAWRSAQVWNIFRNEFAARGKEGRLQFMLCGPTDDQGRLEAWRSVLSSSAYNPSGLWPHMVCKSIYAGIGMRADLGDNTDAFWNALNEEKRQVFATDWAGIPGYKNIPYNQDKVKTHFSPTIPLGVYEFGVELPNTGYLAAVRDPRMEALWNDLVRKARASMPLINVYAYCTQFSSGIKILALKEHVGQPDSGAPAWRGVISAGAGGKP